MTLREQVLSHLNSLRAAGVLFVPGVPMNLSSSPAAVATEQFRRCAKCGATKFVPFTPSTAVPCSCGGEMLVSVPNVADMRAERERCAAALERLAARCEENAGPDGKVTAAAAAGHMRNLAQWMRTE